LIELHLDGSESVALTIGELRVHMFLLHESLEVLQKRPIALLLRHQPRCPSSSERHPRALQGVHATPTPRIALA
jgi:hypothetical protein